MFQFPRSSVALSAFLLLIATAFTAYADVAPPPDYVESCTPENYQSSTEQCELCGTYFREPDRCRNEYVKRGFDYKCRTRGASVWKEVWCRSKDATSPAPAPVVHGDDPDPFPANRDPNLLAHPSSTEPSSEKSRSASSSPPAIRPSGGACGSCAVGSRTGTATTVVFLLLLSACAVLTGRRKTR